MIPTVQLPRDGAVFHCTFVKDGVECEAVATKGLAYIAWEVALVAKPSGVTFMRALCPKHIKEVSIFAGYTTA